MSTKKGREAEKHAARYLERRGWHILGRNIRMGRGELDIIARQGEYLAFIEVKLRKNREDAILSIHQDKQKRLHSAARAWLGRHPQQARHLQSRFDLIILTPSHSWIKRNGFHIEHMQDIIR